MTPIGAIAQEQVLRSRILHLKTLRRYAKENYAEAVAHSVSEEQLKVIENEIREIDEERTSIKRRIMLLKLKYGV